MSLFDRGEDEAFKGAMHGSTLTLCAVMGAYNWAVWKKPGRGTGWHLFSAVVYGVVSILEIIQVCRHTKGSCGS